MRKDSKQLAQEEKDAEIEKAMKEFGFNSAEQDEVRFGTLTVEGVLSKRAAEKAALVQAMAARNRTQPADEPRARPAGTLEKAADAIGTYSRAATVVEKAGTTALMQEMDPVIEDAARIKVELDAIETKHGDGIRKVLMLDPKLGRFGNTASVLNGLYRLAETTTTILGKSAWLASVPKMVQNIPYSGFPAAEASRIKRAVEATKNDPALALGFVKQLEDGVAELDRRLAASRGPETEAVNMREPVTLPNPMAAPQVVREFDVFTGEPGKPEKPEGLFTFTETPGKVER